MIGKIILLKSGIKGKCISRLSTGEYMLKYGKGGKIEIFSMKDIA